MSQKFPFRGHEWKRHVSTGERAYNPDAATTGDDYRKHHRGRSLQVLLRNAYAVQMRSEECDQERSAIERERRAVRDILFALAKLPDEPGHACCAECPCQKEKQCE